MTPPLSKLGLKNLLPGRNEVTHPLSKLGLKIYFVPPGRNKVTPPLGKLGLKKFYCMVAIRRVHLVIWA